MKKTFVFILSIFFNVVVFSVFLSHPNAIAQDDIQGINSAQSADSGDWDDEEYLDEDIEDEAMEDISDPIEPVNRFFFTFNDHLYFKVVKPFCKVYNKAVPEPARRGVRAFFAHVYTPVRAANCLLQGKVDGFVREVARFIINTTAGCLGFRDAAFEDYHIAKSQEDFGQTLGFYGIGAGPYLVIPFLGPRTLRDAVGTAADSFMYPPNYYLDGWTSTGLSFYRKVNYVSLTLGEYEAFKETAIDPYVSIRQAYYQYREKLIKK